jgi:hypothetical protein
MVVLVTALAAVTALAGCALTPGTQGGGMRDITTEEIQASQADNLMDLIEKIRPGWLYFHNLRDPRDAHENQGPLVMINDVPPRPLFTLQYLTLENVTAIRYLTGTYALNRYRVDSPSGVILVISPPMVGPDPKIPPDTGRVSGSDSARTDGARTDGAPTDGASTIGAPSFGAQSIEDPIREPPARRPS